MTHQPAQSIQDRKFNRVSPGLDKAHEAFYTRHPDLVKPETISATVRREGKVVGVYPIWMHYEHSVMADRCRQIFA